jgi:hypothetical protein
MKDILKSLKENTISRLKNPIVGAFVLSWTVLNVNGVSLFLMVDTATKIKIVERKQWLFFDDFGLPLLSTLLYLFLLPILHMGYDYINYGVINYWRENKKNKTDKKLFIERKETVKAKIEADESYIRKLKEKEIEGWLEEQSKRNSEFIALKERYSQRVVENSVDTKKSLIEQTKHRKLMYEVNEKIKYLESEAQKKKSSIELQMNTLDDFIKKIQNESVTSEVSNDIKIIQSSITDLRFEFDVWDEDIPF